MSLRHIADHVAAKGRNGDSMLVHMTPEEVGGLHAIALSAYGKPLTVNPETGVVEASLLKKLLPTIAGAIVGNIIPGAGAWGSAIAGGIAGGAANGWNLRSIGAGLLGGYTGRELGRRLAAVGEPTTSQTQAQTQPATPVTDEFGDALPVSERNASPIAAKATGTSAPAAVSRAADKAVVEATKTPVTPTFKNMGEGLRRILTDEKLRKQFTDQNLWPLLGAVGSVAGAPDKVSAPERNDPRFWRTRFRQGRVNPNWQQGQGQPYWLDRGFDEGEYVTGDPFAGYASGGSTTTEQPLKEGPVVPVAPASSDYKSPYHSDVMAFIDAVNARRKPSPHTSTGTDTAPTTGPGTGTPNEGTNGARNDTGVSTGSGTGSGVATGVVPSLPYTPVVSDVPVVTETPPRAPDYISPYGNNGGLRDLINSRLPNYTLPNFPTTTDQGTAQAVYDPETGERTDTPEPAPERSGILDTGRNLINLPGDVKQIIADRAIDAMFDLFQREADRPTYDENGNRVDTPEERSPMENRVMQGARIFANPLDAILHPINTVTNLWQGNPVEPIKNPLIDISTNITKTPEEIAREEESARRRAQTRANREANGGTGAGSGGGGSGVARAGNGSGRGGISLPRAGVTVQDVGPGKARGGRVGRYASGGVASLGGYSDGGRLLRGPGDGVSDDIPAGIYRNDGSRQEARLADGEFVLPARIVSEIGNGSTEAGAQKLYAIMDRIQQDRSRTLKDVAKDTNAERHFASMMA